MRQGKKLPFSKIVYCNIGNPQALHQPAITYPRQVLALCEYPALLKSSSFPNDVKARAEAYLKEMVSLGSYSPSKGLYSIRQNVAEFIKKRDNGTLDVDLESVFLTGGASPGIQLVLSSLIRSENDGIMIPIPQYPLYSASIALYGGSQVDYKLNEDSDWTLDVRCPLSLI